MESRKLLLENTFAIKKVFSNNEATSWAVEELKRRGLKRLFKLVAPTAYERLVREFYTHLRIDGTSRTYFSLPLTEEKWR
jgi:hypothetical protein